MFYGFNGHLNVSLKDPIWTSSTGDVPIGTNSNYRLLKPSFLPYYINPMASSST
jgi:hypothetical protein